MVTELPKSSLLRMQKSRKLSKFLQSKNSLTLREVRVDLVIPAKKNNFDFSGRKSNLFENFQLYL